MEGGMIGRQRELDAADRWLELVPGGLTSLAVVGPAGIGKTTVWTAVLDRASARGWRILSARAAEAEAGLALATAADVCAPLPSDALDELPSVQRQALAAMRLEVEADADAPADPRLLGTAIQAAVRSTAAAGAPLIVAIDDVQWIDPASRRVLEFALRRLHDQPIGFVATVRADTVDAARRAELELDLPDARRLALPIPPMTLAALHTLIAETTGVALSRSALVRLEHVTQGNPLLAIEIVRSILEQGREVTFDTVLPVPPSVGDLVQARLASLPEATRSALAAAAALARPDLATLDRLGVGSTDLEAAIDARLIELDGETVRFTHPLFAAALLEAQPPHARRALHAQLAALAGHPEERARHLALASDLPDAETATILEAAAGQAAARGAPDASAEMLQLSIARTPVGCADELGRRELRLAQDLWDIGDVERSVRLLRSAAERIRGRDRVTALHLLAVIAAWREGTPAAWPYLDDALAEAAGDPITEATIRLRVAYLADEDPPRGLEQARQALALLDRPDVDAPDLLACALLLTADHTLSAAGVVDEALVDRARALLPPSPDPPARQMAFYARGIARERLNILATRLDRLGEARELLAGRLVQDRAMGLDRPSAISLADLAELCCLLGDLDAARGYVHEATDLLHQTGATPFARIMVGYGEAVVAAYGGELDEARRRIADVVALSTEVGEVDTRLRATALLGHVELAADRPADAAVATSTVHEATHRAGMRDPAAYRIAGDHVEALVLTGRIDEARAAVRALEPGHRDPRPWRATIAERSAGILAAADGDLDAAEHRLTSAVERAGSLGMPVELGRSWMALGRVHRRRKQKRLAATALAHAVEVFGRAGAGAWRERAERERARVGLRPTAPESLTPTEAEVARLTAQGLTNRQVADALVMSPKSIESVLSRVYGKLGIRSRAELGARMADQASGSD